MEPTASAPADTSSAAGSAAGPAATSPAATDSEARRYATGRQYELRRGDALAVITELAGGVRLYSRAGVALTETYADDEIAPGAAGIMLAPWANRIEDGIWYLDGKKLQLDITEVSFNNASHGLLRNTGYALVDEDEFSVTLEAAVFPQHGYPFLLRHRVRYSLGEDLGLTVRQTLINDGRDSAPFVLGAHPYLRISDVPTEDLTVTVSGVTRLVTDERQIPRDTEPVAGDYDLRSGRRAGDLDLDSAYTDLEFDGGEAGSTLHAPDGRSVTLWQDEHCGYVHVFVTDRLPGLNRAVALEPMTGPANAFNSGDGLRWLAAGEEFSMTWGIRATLNG
ncbi:aldose 1-epimerase family protein [Arthrobacter sp. YD4]|uniref:aldose 1-epimerase family protein n=1 Tax=Arthrobacter sp. YD4 TaxID=3058043 RepID=UPI0025B610C4|nr:aldose 1-epimerase family protein [Arthrobacter sp. YD4]MDN3937524.1 aldose 1-epimerase family protein [Arthrobacter sp. YD4]